MRDPARIDPLLDLIRRIMHANPDLRLGQIISIVSAQPFYLEDDVLTARLRERFESAPKKADPADFAPKRRNCWTCRNNTERNMCAIMCGDDYVAMIPVSAWIREHISPGQDMPPTSADNCPGYEETP